MFADAGIRPIESPLSSGTLRGMTRIPAMTVHKWRALSLKRLAHLSELRRSGRWHRFYAGQAAFEEAVRHAELDAERWKGLAYADSPPVQPAE
jgi:hypothetical protein